MQVPETYPSAVGVRVYVSGFMIVLFERKADSVEQGWAGALAAIRRLSLRPLWKKLESKLWVGENTTASLWTENFQISQNA